MEVSNENPNHSSVNGAGHFNLDATPEQPSGPTVFPPTEEAVCETKRKIDVLLKAVGDTPIMKNKKWTIEKTRTIQGLMDFIKKYLKLESSEQMFLYFSLTFQPEPIFHLGLFFKCFGSDGRLVLHYCKSQAWG
ncbi:ubiquitin-like protein ATG12 [Pelodytes ibericus]